MLLHQHLANMLTVHGVKCSVLRHIQYETYKSLGMGICSETMFSFVEKIYYKAAEDTTNEALENTLNMEIDQVIANTEYPSGFTGIDIITDARHGPRKHSAYSDVKALGGSTDKVVSAQVISKQDDLFSKRDELLGVKRIYQEFFQFASMGMIGFHL